MVRRPRTFCDWSTSIVAISLPALRASAGLHRAKASSELAGCGAEMARNSAIIERLFQSQERLGAVDVAAVVSRNLIVTVGFMVTALSLGSCAEVRGVRPLRPLELATAPYSEVVTAVHSGSLMYEGGCLLFRDERSRTRLMPVWPTGIAQEFVMTGHPVLWNELPGDYRPFHQQCGAEPFLVSRVRPAN